MPLSSVSWALVCGLRRGSVVPFVILDFLTPLLFVSGGAEALRLLADDLFGTIVRYLDVANVLTEILGTNRGR